MMMGNFPKWAIIAHSIHKRANMLPEHFEISKRKDKIRIIKPDICDKIKVIKPDKCAAFSLPFNNLFFHFHNSPSSHIKTPFFLSFSLFSAASKGSFLVPFHHSLIYNLKLQIFSNFCCLPIFQALIPHQAILLIVCFVQQQLYPSNMIGRLQTRV